MKKIIILLILANLLQASALANQTQTLNSIEQRIKPIGQVDMQAKKVTVSTSSTPQLSGEEIYGKYCTACHSSGAAGSPKLDDPNAWKPRVAQGKEVLYQHAIQGYKLMPPKGTCMTCSDEDIKKTVDYMLQKAGVK